jgi:hypothetical protein
MSKVFIIRTVGDSCCGAFYNLRSYRTWEEAFRVCVAGNIELRKMKDEIRKMELSSPEVALTTQERREEVARICSRYPTVVGFEMEYPQYCDGFEVEEIDLV